MPEQQDRLIGMGITGPDNSALELPVVSDLKADAGAVTDIPSIFDEPSTSDTNAVPTTPSRSSGIEVGRSPQNRSSPRFPSQSPAKSTLSRNEQRDRMLSPKKLTFETVGGNDILPVLQTHMLGGKLADQPSPIWSPAIDGKKEPSIKPAPPGYETHEATMLAQANAKNRGRSPYGSSSNKPLTGAVASTAIGSGSIPTEGGFYDSTAYWLGLYFFFNLGLTLFNKLVLVSFPFPYVSPGPCKGSAKMTI
jgi:hypothetical protein